MASAGGGPGQTCGSGGCGPRRVGEAAAAAAAAAAGGGGARGGAATPGAELRRLAAASEASRARMQLAAELLLLSGEARPVSWSGAAASAVASADSSFAKCRDAVIARSKGLLIAALDAQNQAGAGRPGEAAESAARLGELVVALTECAAEAAYRAGLAAPGSSPARPGLADAYRVARSQHEVEAACARLRHGPLEDLTPQVLLDISAGVSRHLRLLTDACGAEETGPEGDPAADPPPDPFAREQFKLGVRSAGACASALLAGIRALKAAPGEATRARALLFAAPLVHAVRALAGLASEPRCRGRAATLGPEGRAAHTAIAGGAMSVVSACVLVVECLGDNAQLQMQQLQQQQQQQRRHGQAGPADARRVAAALGERLRQAVRAASDGCEMLSHALRERASPRAIAPAMQSLALS
ncbi:talin rod domain-containing protein 1-like [Lethenteron reissneri]|uniref:talin rod domain-containing protein 1-like n=1 Tax=Lethenteron reissneri TaxID=7753 RepID=UPI002AB7A8C5|nr:talin rod domain-containing protein 1-like [Lethenteron reissneri]